MIGYDDFSKVDMRVGKIIDAQDFPEARKPAYKLRIDFGTEIGMKNSCAQLTQRYEKEGLIGRKIVAVVNFPPKQVANFLSEVLVLGSGRRYRWNITTFHRERRAARFESPLVSRQ